MRERGRVLFQARLLGAAIMMLGLGLKAGHLRSQESA